MLVGIGGNNGTTVVAGVLANKLGLEWQTKDGIQKANYLGSLTQSATLKMGDSGCEEIFMPFNQIIPMLDPNELLISGWDISGANLREAAVRAKVLPVEVQRKLGSMLEKIKPLRSIYYPDFIAANQRERADHIYTENKPCLSHLEAIQKDIRDFKKNNSLEKVVVLWTANTERFCKVSQGVHDTEENFMKGVEAGHSEISPSQVYLK